jgi:hypothetical protein
MPPICERIRFVVVIDITLATVLGVKQRRSFTRRVT